MACFGQSETPSEPIQNCPPIPREIFQCVAKIYPKLFQTASKNVDIAKFDKIPAQETKTHPHERPKCVGILPQNPSETFGL